MLLLSIRERFSNHELIGQSDNSHLSHNNPATTNNKINKIYFTKHSDNNYDSHNYHFDDMESDLSNFKQNVGVCHSDERLRDVYQSDGSMVEVVVPVPSSSITFNLLLHFQGGIVTFFQISVKSFPHINFVTPIK